MALAVLGVGAVAAVGALIGWSVVQALDSPAADGTSGGDDGAPGPTDAAGALEPAVLDQVAGRWLTVLVTLPGQWDQERVAQSVAEMAGRGLEVDALHSDEVASFTPGSWVLFESDWATPEEALGRCTTLGFSNANQCVARLASGDAADRDQVRSPQA